MIQIHLIAMKIERTKLADEYDLVDMPEVWIWKVVFHRLETQMSFYLIFIFIIPSATQPQKSLLPVTATNQMIPP